MNRRVYHALEAGKRKRIALDTVGTIATVFGIAAWQFLGPELPANTRLKSALPAVTLAVYVQDKRGRP